MRHHDPSLHARLKPGGDVAPAIFEMLEQARVEAIGAKRMSGLDDNIAAALEDRYRREGLHRVTERNDATMPEAVRLMARQMFTGAEPPPAAQGVFDQWEAELRDKIGADLEELSAFVNDQAAYSRAARQLITDLDIEIGIEDESEDSEAGDDESDEDSMQSESEDEGGDSSDAAGKPVAIPVRPKAVTRKTATPIRKIQTAR